MWHDNEMVCRNKEIQNVMIISHSILNPIDF
jgi:hypothetical protein